jgi:hypothetical protein
MAEVELPKPDELHEHAANSFSRRVALVTAIYAVVLAIAALGGNHAMKEMLLAQQQSRPRSSASTSIVPRRFGSRRTWPTAPPRRPGRSTTRS